MGVGGWKRGGGWGCGGEGVGRGGERINCMCCKERNNLARCVADLGLMY